MHASKWLMLCHGFHGRWECLDNECAFLSIFFVCSINHGVYNWCYTWRINLTWQQLDLTYKELMSTMHWLRSMSHRLSQLKTDVTMYKLEFITLINILESFDTFFFFFSTWLDSTLTLTYYPSCHNTLLEHMAPFTIVCKNHIQRSFIEIYAKY